MEQKLHSILPYKHISYAANESLNYMESRRMGLTKSLTTRWAKFNALTMGGIEPNVIITIAGISGSGKSSIANSLETDLIELNQNVDIIVLSFSFEMLSARQVGRKISYKLKKTANELYSGNLKLTEETLNKAKIEAQKIAKYPIYYVDTYGSVSEIADTIDFFQNSIAKDKWLIVIIDHTLLVKGDSSSSERSTIVDLEKVLIGAKKVGKTSIIQISQMNRNIESSERINNNANHYPQRGDLSSSDAVFQASDYVIVVHRPEMLGISRYGPSNLPVKETVFMHFLKNREGEVKILKFQNQLKYNNLVESEEEQKEEQSQPLLLFKTDNENDKKQ